MQVGGGAGLNEMMKVMLSLIVVLVLTGCVSTYLTVRNNLSESVVVTSGHTGESFRIKPNRTRKIPHTLGPVTVQTASGKRREYPSVNATDGQNTRHFIFWRKVVKPFEINEHEVSGRGGQPQR